MLYDEHLNMFLQVADAGSFSKAADAVFVTPSAVIKQINLIADKSR
ncbi:MAG: LysR family transcriptional regulator [Eubacterium sp.]|nr:LysR family transcriptional regulator [Eubacterium sp.]